MSEPEDLDLTPEAIQRALRERYGLRAPVVPKRKIPLPTVEELREALGNLTETLAAERHPDDPERKAGEA